MAWINKITFTPEVGDVYDAVVKTIMPYGAFVDFNGKSGLLHISEISYTRIDNVEEVFAEGDKVKVKLVEIDNRTGKMRLSRKALMDKPEGYVERERRDRDDSDSRDRGDNRGRGGDRHGGRDNRGNDRNKR